MAEAAAVTRDGAAAAAASTVDGIRARNCRWRDDRRGVTVEGVTGVGGVVAAASRSLEGEAAREQVEQGRLPARLAGGVVSNNGKAAGSIGGCGRDPPRSAARDRGRRAERGSVLAAETGRQLSSRSGGDRKMLPLAVRSSRERPDDEDRRLSLSRAPGPACVLTMADSMTTSVGPPIMMRCSTLSRRTRDQLPLPVEVVGVHDAQTRLARPTADGSPQPPAEQQAIENIDDGNQNDDRGHGRRIG